MRKLFFIILSTIAIITINHLDALADEYIKIIKDVVNIRFEPNTSSTIIAKGKKGDVFELVESEGKWYSIYMFSGEKRYLFKSLSKKINDAPGLPKSTKIKIKVFRELKKSEHRATNQAVAKYPNDINKQIDFERLLDDRYKLIIFQKYAISPARYNKLAVEGIENGW